MGKLSSMPIYTFSDSSSGSQCVANGETLTADTAQDNPVGIIEKSIYIIRNHVNDKVYIGQAVDPYKRFLGHLHASTKRAYRSAIDGAIKKYGAENFYYEILEESTPNYNEREKYWISFFDSICPNGYNIQRGGEEPPVRCGFANNKSKFTEQDIKNIHRILLNPAVTIKDIAKAYGVTYHTIASINKGERYVDESIDYPIRKFQCSGEHDNTLSPNIVNAIIYDICNTDDSLRVIAKRYCANDTQVKEINEGSVLMYRKDGFQYPLRESSRTTNKQAEQIIRELSAGVKSKQQISKDVGVSYNVVNAINTGRSFFREDLVYPLKKHEGRYDYDEELWEEIRKRLKRGDAPKTIAADLHLPNVSMAFDINTGKTHRSDDYTYPIQQSQNRFSDDVIKKVTDEIAHSNKSLTQIGKENGMHKSTVIQLKNGAYKKYRISGYEYPLR